MFTENYVNTLCYMTSTVLDGAAHAFTTRFGGVSEGMYESLNLGSNHGDEPERVLENYDRICRIIGTEKEKLVLTHQVHGTDVRVVTHKDSLSDIFKAATDCDGLVTAERGLPLMIFTADCIPILLHDPVCGAVGAVHAGWRGTVGGIVCEVVKKLCTELGCRTENIRAAIGPGISQCCFATDRDVPDAVIEKLGEYGRAYIAEKDNKFYVNLKGINRELLMHSGVLPENIDISKECTMCRSDKYWSHRATHGQRGSQASIIMLT